MVSEIDEVMQEFRMVLEYSPFFASLAYPTVREWKAVYCSDEKVMTIDMTVCPVMNVEHIPFTVVISRGGDGKPKVEVEMKKQEEE